MYDYPAEGTPLGVRVARLRRPTPCRQSSTTTPRSGSADRAPSKDSRGCKAPPAEQRRSRQLCQTHKPPPGGCVWQSGGARSGGKPDKAGANCEMQ